MRVLLHVKIPHEPFNTAVRKGTAGDRIQQILAESKRRLPTSLNTKADAEPFLSWT